MKVDVYSLGPSKSSAIYGPCLVSFDHDFLLNPEGDCCQGFFSSEGIIALADLFFPTGIKDIKNGLRIPIEGKEIGKSNLMKKLSETGESISETRGHVIKEYGVGSSQNSYMAQVQKMVGSTTSFLDFVSKDSRDILIVTHNANPQQHLFLRKKNLDFGPCGIHSAEIETLDPESSTYTGTINWSDYVERCNPTDRFIACTLPQEVAKDIGDSYSPFFVRNSETFLGAGYQLTLLPDFNKAIRKYVNETIAMSQNSQKATTTK